MSWYPYDQDLDFGLHSLDFFGTVQDVVDDGLSRLLTWLFDCLDRCLIVQRWQCTGINPVPDRIGLLLGSVPAYFGPECLGGRGNRNRIGCEDLYDRTGTGFLEFRPDLDIRPEFR